MTVIIPGMNMNFERVPVRPTNVSLLLFLSIKFVASVSRCVSYGIFDTQFAISRTFIAMFVVV